MRRVAAKDALFLYTDTPSTHMHMGFVGVFDPSTVPGGEDGSESVYERIRDLYERRLHLFPPFRQRLVEVPFDLHHPVFVEDPAFDLDFHLRRAVLPAPGGSAELEALAGELLGRKLDFDHPLWEAHVVEGLEDGRWAFVAKTHHVIVDGVAGNEALVNLLDLSPEGEEPDPPEEPWEPERVPGDLRMLSGAVAGLVRQPLRLASAVGETSRALGGVVRGALRRRLPGGDEQPPLRVIGPRTLLNGPVGPHRQVAFGQLDLGAIKDVKDAADCTVNDVVVALCGRGLRRFLHAHDDTYDGGLVAAQPISVRAEGDAEIDNQVAGMTVPCHDDVEDPAEQLRRVHAAARPAKEQLGAVSASLLTNWSQFAAPVLAAQAFRFYSRSGLEGRHPPIANVTLSNIPGPDFPLYLGGSEMEAMYPLGPVIHGQGLNITLVSYRGTMFVGVVADRDRIPDVAPLPEHLAAGLEDLEAVAAGA